jgi:1,2-diacylglycerol 3-beta-glucosyltransferase
LHVDLTYVSYFMAAVVSYYGLLFVLSISRRRPMEGVVRDPFIVIVVPAHNEETVIGETLAALTTLAHEDFFVVVLNDGSSDSTSERARRFESTGRVVVVDRAKEIAGRGKGAVLNHAFGLLNSMVQSCDPRFRGRNADEVVVGVTDADGQLDRHTLGAVAPYFADPRVGGVQIGVRIANAADGFLARMQDMEFVGFSVFVQVARDRFGSVGLGGNGQFTRLSALRSLGREPWTDCLTEDLDLGLSLIEHGWRLRYCRDAFVAQQGLVRWRPLLRQRTRWLQGHYQCWRHIPALLRAQNLRLVTRLDLVVYLVMVIFVVVVFANLVISTAGMAGFLLVENHFLETVPPGPPRNVLLEAFSFGPLIGFLFTYQSFSAHRLRWAELPAYGALFALYAYVFIISTLWAWARMLLRRGNWSKTPRVAAKVAAS